MTATFMGTDYNYANSNDFRRHFMDYCASNEDIKEQVMKDDHSERPSMSPLVNRDLQNNSEFNDYAQNLLRI